MLLQYENASRCEVILCDSTMDIINHEQSPRTGYKPCFEDPSFGNWEHNISNMKVWCISGVIVGYKIHSRSLFYPPMPTLCCVRILIKTAQRPKIHFSVFMLITIMNVIEIPADGFSGGSVTVRARACKRQRGYWRRWWGCVAEMSVSSDNQVEPHASWSGLLAGVYS